jgi:hypothetical protein
MPSLFGVLLAGGGSGKTEMIDGLTDSVIEVHARHEPERVARHLAAEVRRITAAEAVLRGPDAPRERVPGAGERWEVTWWKRYVGVSMPVARERCIAWDILAGLHLSDDFLFWSWRRDDGGAAGGAT